MSLLGLRLRQRRRLLQLNQADVAGQSSASFLSKVENGVTSPSLRNLELWSEKLQTTCGELMGDHILLEAAKLSILDQKQCHSYLDQLPETTLSQFLRDLSSSASSLSSPLPPRPKDPELLYLYAKVLLNLGMLQDAQNLVEELLAQNIPTLWRVHHLALVCQIFGELGEIQKKEQAKAQMQALLADLDPKGLRQALPEAPMLRAEDLLLLQLSDLSQVIL